MDDKDWGLYKAIHAALENPNPAQRIRDAANAAESEADPFIIPTGIPDDSDKPFDAPDPEKDLAVLVAVETCLALMEGQHGVPLLLNDRMEALRAMLRDGLTRYECKERIIAFYTSRLP